MKRRRLSPARLRPKKIDTVVTKIVDQAAKKFMEYNQIQINNIMQSDKDNREKVEELMKLSKTRFPKLTKCKKNRKTRKNNESKKVSKKKVLEDDDLTITIEEKKHNSIVSVYSSTFTESKGKVLSTKGSNAKEDFVDLQSDADMSNKSGVKSGSTVKTSNQSKMSPSGESLEIDEQFSNKTSAKMVTLKSEPLQESILINKIEKKAEDEKNEDTVFHYEIEIKTGGEENTNQISDIFLILNGETNKSTKKLCLREHFRPKTSDDLPFRRGNLDKFEILSSDYMGTIQNVVIGLDNQSQDSSWFLEYIYIKDSTSSKDYRFPCRRWIGKACADQLTEVKLGYTPPYKKDNHTHLSNSCEDENLEPELMLKPDGNDTSTLPPKPLLKEDYNYGDSLIESEVQTSSRSLADISQRSSSVDSENVTEDVSSQLSITEGLSQSSDIETSPKSSVLFGKSIHSAIMTHDIDRVKDLCSFHNRLKYSEDSDGNAPIHLAAIYYKDDDVCRGIIQYLILSNVDPNIKSNEGYTPFLLAVVKGNLESVKYLNETVKVNLDERDDKGNTALHLATFNNFDVIAKYLISNGADISIKNRSGESPMYIAKRHHYRKLISLYNKVKAAKKYPISDGNEEAEDASLKGYSMDGKPKSLNVLREKEHDTIVQQIDKVQPKENSKELIISSKNTHKNTHPVITNSINDLSEECEEEVDEGAKNYELESDLSSLDVEYHDEDDRGILFNKRISTQHVKSRTSNESSNLSNLKNVHFEDASSSISAISNGVSSPCSSALSSPLSGAFYESSIESVKELQSSVDKEMRLSDNLPIVNSSPVSKMSEKPTDKDVESALKEDVKSGVFDPDATNANPNKTIVNET